MLALLQAAEPAQGVIPGLSVQAQTNLITSMIVILAIFAIRRALLAVVHRRVQDSAIRYRWGKATASVAFVITLVALWMIWFTAMRSLGTFLGLLSAGLAIALKDMVADLAGWLFIVWRRPFDLGDRIQVGPHAGDVVDRRIFQFTIMEIGNWISADQSTGRLIHIPNAKLFTEPLANYIAGFPYLWNELPVMVTFESDWRRAKEIIAQVADDIMIDLEAEKNSADQREQRFLLINYRKLTPIVYTSVEDSGILLTLRYLCRPRERRGTSSEIWERILGAIEAEPAIALAYPTQRINLDREVRAEPTERPEGSAGSDAE